MVLLSRKAHWLSIALLTAWIVLSVAMPNMAWAQVSAPSGASEASADAQPEGLSPERAKALADLLADDKTRDALVQQLERLATPAGGAAVEGAANPEEAGKSPPAVSLVRNIAKTTQEFAQRVAHKAVLLGDQLADAPQTLSSIGDVPFDVVIEAVTELLLVMATTIGLFLLLRRGVRHLFRWMGPAAQAAGPLGTVLIIAASVVIRLSVVVLAWAGGYLITLTAFGDLAEIGIRQTLYLNAFLIVEMAKVVVRALLSPTSAQLRLVAIPDKGARVLSRWINVSIGLIGYGQLLIVPIVSQNVSGDTGLGVATLLAAAAVGVLIVLAVTYRRAVATWFLVERNIQDRSAPMRFLARNWHIPILIYLISLLIIVLARPGGILLPVLIISGQVLAAVIFGFIVGSIIKKATARGIRLPDPVNQRLPLMERRLNSFVPKALWVVRLLIELAVLGFALQVVGLLNVEAWLSSQFGVRLTGTLVTVLLILVGAFAVWLALSSWIDYRLNPEFGSVPTARERTLLTLLKNAAIIVIIVITMMFVLSEIGIDIAPLIASAGVLGLAIGFGAQKLVQDIITGVFIQFENAINVGDIISLGGTTGTVERLTIRSVSLRDLQGVFHIIPFSSVDMVSNYMRGFAYYLCDMGVAYRENVEDAKQAMLDAFAELRADPAWQNDILEDIQWMGLHAFGDSAIILRARIKCAPGRHMGVGRAYNLVLKRIFDERGIEIPFPHQTIYFGEDKKGQAPPLRVFSVPEPKSAPVEGG